MSILVTKKTKVICQGITGNNGTFYSEQVIAHGAQMIAGLALGDGGIEGSGLNYLHSYTYTV